MHTLLQDLRYALRLIRKAPAFAAVTILSLALGIGATTAVFSVIRAVLLDPYPYKDANRMVHVELRGKDDRSPLLMVNQASAPELRRVDAIDDFFTMDNHSASLTGDQFPVSVQEGLYSPNLFNFMGVPMLYGRGFTQMDASGNGGNVVVLSYLFWKNQFGGNSDIVGKRIELDHAAYTVIGIAPPRFTWGDSDIYMIAPPNPNAHDYSLAFIKVKPGVSYSALAAQIQPVVDHIAHSDPQFYPQNRKVAIVSLNQEILGKFQGALVFLFAAVFLLLLIGCANVSILLLARGTAREHEFAVRTSVGAARGRLIRQLLTESVLLAVIGAALGVAMAYRGVGFIASYLPFFTFPHEAAAGIHVNFTVLAFSTGLAVLTGILFGISPAWQLSRPQGGGQIAQSMQAGSAKLAGKAGGQKTHRILIVGQVALTMLLLAAAGTATRAFLKLYHTPLGFDPDQVFTTQVTLPPNTAPSWKQRANLHEALRRAISETPGIGGAAVSNSWFPPQGGFRAKILIASQPNLTDAEAQLALVSPQIFSTLHIPLLRGRIFTEQETAAGAHVVVVNRTFVRQYLGTTDPIGQSVRSPMLKVDFTRFVSAPEPDGWLEIVGVVEDSRNDGLDRPIRPQVFIPYTMILPPDMYLLSRVQGIPTTAAMHDIGTRLHQTEPDASVSQQHEVRWMLDNFAWSNERFLAGLFGVFAVLALLLAAAGLYSVVSYAAARRTQEMGLRMALGASRRNIVALVLGSSLTMVAIGAGVGIAISIGLSHYLSKVVAGSSSNPITLLAVAALLMLVALLACITPAWRAATIDPMRALREE